MKRPLFLFFVGLVSGELAAMIGNGTGGFVLALIVWFSGVILRRLRRHQRLLFSKKQKEMVRNQEKAILIVCLAFLLGFIHFLYHACSDQRRRDGLPRENVCLQGRIDALTVNAEGNYVITLDRGIYGHVVKPENPGQKREEKKQEKAILGKCQVFLGDSVGLTLMPGDWVRFTGDLVNLEKPTNPGAFDGRIYALSRGITCQFWAESGRKIGESFFFPKREVYLCRQKIARVYQQIMEKEKAALLRAMILGDKSQLRPEQKRRYEDSGTAHLLAVSGLHISIVSGSVFRCLRKKKLSYGICCLAGASMVWFYGMLTGMGNAVLRAFIMYMVYLGAEYFGAEYDLTSSLALAGILMLLESPWRLLEGGFQISFAAVLAIGAVLPWIRELAEKRERGILEKENEQGNSKKKRLKGKRLPDFYTVRRWFKEAWLADLVVTEVTLPIVLRVFYQCCPYSIFLNLLVIPAMTPLMVSGCLAGLTGLWSLTLAKWCSYPARMLLALFDGLFLLVKQLPLSLLVTGCPDGKMVVCFFLLEGWLVYLWYNKKRKMLVCTGVILSLGWYVFSLRPMMQVTMLDVGQGEAIYIRTPEGANLLLDGGSTSDADIGRRVLKPALQYYGAGKLEYLLVSHADEDHISGIRELLEMGYPVEYLVIREGAATDQALIFLLSLAVKNGTKIVKMKAGDQIVFKTLRLVCLHPAPGFPLEDRNEASLVFQLCYRQFDLLLTGDLGPEGERCLSRVLFEEQRDRENKGESRKTEILKVAHHGAKTSTSPTFLHKLSPENALISSGKGNRYGHPHEELKERLRRQNIRIWQTREGGAVLIRTDGRQYRMGYYDKTLANVERLPYSTTCR